jgi:hypothetical protein
MYEIIYSSAARRLFELQQLGAMLEAARLNNGRLGVSGILLYEAGSFLQVLEGEEAVVTALFSKIAGDTRHSSVRVLRQRTIAARSFSEWTMGFVTLDPQLMRSFPKRHALSSNGSSTEDAAATIELLDQFRAGRWRSYILG